MPAAMGSLYKKLARSHHTPRSLLPICCNCQKPICMSAQLRLSPTRSFRMPMETHYVLRNNHLLQWNSPETISIPVDFQCPITKVIMVDPVIASDGYTYEFKSLQQLAQTSGYTAISPLTRAPLKQDVYTNVCLRNTIQFFVEANDGFVRTSRSVPDVVDIHSISGMSLD
jgi:hypothetical protein